VLEALQGEGVDDGAQDVEVFGELGARGCEAPEEGGGGFDVGSAEDAGVEEGGDGVCGGEGGEGGAGPRHLPLFVWRVWSLVVLVGGEGSTLW